MSRTLSEMLRRSVWVLILTAAWGCWTGAVKAQLLRDGPILGAMPGIETAPAPAWMQPGVRLTYYSAIANVASDLEYWEQDEQGGWVDPATGERWAKRKGAKEARGAGHGYTQVNVVSADQQHVVLEVRAYGFPKYEGPLALLSAASVVTVPGFGDDWWVNPAALQQARTGSYKGLTVLPMNHVAEGRTYRALRIQFEGKSTVLLTGLGGEMIPSDTALKSRNVRVYDLDSGVLLYAGTAGASPKGTTLTEATLVGTRRVSVPWARQAAPSWIRQVTTIDYEGSLHVPYGARPVTAPVSGSITLNRRGPDWAHFTYRTSMASPLPGVPTVAEAQLVTGSAQFGGLWIPPAGLIPLQPGQVLDSDPRTGFTVSVARADPQSVVISEVSPLQRIEYTYDRKNGLMVHYAKTDYYQFNIQTVLRFTGWR